MDVVQVFDAREPSAGLEVRRTKFHQLGEVLENLLAQFLGLLAFIGCRFRTLVRVANSFDQLRHALLDGGDQLAAGLLYLLATGSMLFCNLLTIGDGRNDLGHRFVESLNRAGKLCRGAQLRAKLGFQRVLLGSYNLNQGFGLLPHFFEDGVLLALE
ncbi:hypothetical protein D9M70_552630 [compost metagenome]